MALEIRKELIEVSINYDNGHVSVLTKDILFDSATNTKVKDLEINRTGYMPSENRKAALLEAVKDKKDIKQLIDDLWTPDYINKKKPKED